jgi:hypothetical protein
MTQSLRARDRFLYFILLWCVFSFKILLGGVGEAGLRIDDLLILVAFLILMFRGDFRRIPRSEALRIYLIFLLINFFSAAWNAMMGRVQFLYATLFTIRLVEYLVFYYLGYALVESGIQVWRGLKIYFYVLCVVVALQSLDLIPVVSLFNAVRASGNTNGPYELAVVAAFFLCYFGYQERQRLSAVAAFVLMLLTASRITFVGTVMGFVWRTVTRSKAKLRVLAVALAMLLVAWGGMALFQSTPNTDEDAESLGNRLQSSSSLFSLDEVSVLWDAVPTYRRAEDYFHGAFLDAIVFGTLSEKDPSGMVRVYRWATLVKTTVSHMDSIVIGLGPSFGSVAVDGYYVRLFAEGGLAGLLMFLFCIRALIKPQAGVSTAFREFVIIVVVTAFFIDIFTSYKTMILLWLWHGMNEYHSSESEQGTAKVALD